MYNLIEYSDNFSKKSGSLWQHYRDEPHASLTNSESLKSKMKIIIPADCNTKNVEIALPLKYLSIFRLNLEMPLINCEINLILTWASTSIVSNSSNAGTFTITDTKLYVPVVTLSTQDNAKLFQQLKSDFKGTINWNKCQLKVSNRNKKPMFRLLN